MPRSKSFPRIRDAMVQEEGEEELDALVAAGRARKMRCVGAAPAERDTSAGQRSETPWPLSPDQEPANPPHRGEWCCHKASATSITLHGRGLAYGRLCWSTDWFSIEREF